MPLSSRRHANDNSEQNHKPLSFDQDKSISECGPHPIRQFATSANGDRWFLISAVGMAEAFVLHKQTERAGGHQTMISMREFLNRDGSSSEEIALVALLTDEHQLKVHPGPSELVRGE